MFGYLSDRFLSTCNTSTCINNILLWQDHKFDLFKLLIPVFSISANKFQAILNTNLSSMWTFSCAILDRKLLPYNLDPEWKKSWSLKNNIQKTERQVCKPKNKKCWPRFQMQVEVQIFEASHMSLWICQQAKIDSKGHKIS